MNHSVALIGLGAIGMLYDLKLPESEYVLCHARAFSQHPDFKLIGSVEPEAMLRKKFSEIYADISEPIPPDKFASCIINTLLVFFIDFSTIYLSHGTNDLK